METIDHTAIKEKVQAYLAKTAPLVEVREMYKEQFLKKKPEKSFEQKLFEVVGSVIYIKKDYLQALELMRPFIKNPIYPCIATEFSFMRAKCYLGLGDYEQALWNINTCISYNSLDASKNAERTFLIQELRSLAIEALGQHPNVAYEKPSSSVQIKNAPPTP